MQSLQALQHARGDGFNQAKVLWPPLREKLMQRRAMVLVHEEQPLHRSPAVEGIDQLCNARGSNEPLGDDSFLRADANFPQ